MEEKIQSGTEALDGPVGGLCESKDEEIAFVKPSPNTNEVWGRKLRGKKKISSTFTWPVS